MTRKQWKTKDKEQRKQEQLGDSILIKFFRRYKKAVVGYSVMVHLSEVDRDRCEFPNVHAVVMELNDAGLYKLGTQDGEHKGYYSRNQFEPLPQPLMNQNLVRIIIEIPLYV